MKKAVSHDPLDNIMGWGSAPAQASHVQSVVAPRAAGAQPDLFGVHVSAAQVAVRLLSSSGPPHPRPRPPPRPSHDPSVGVADAPLSSPSPDPSPPQPPAPQAVQQATAADLFDDEEGPVDPNEPEERRQLRLKRIEAKKCGPPRNHPAPAPTRRRTLPHRLALSPPRPTRSQPAPTPSRRRARVAEKLREKLELDAKQAAELEARAPLTPAPNALPRLAPCRLAQRGPVSF